MKSATAKLAKKALLLSLKDGKIDPVKIRLVARELRKAKFADRLVTLKEYHRLLANKVNENTLLVQTSFELDQATKTGLETALRKKFGDKEIVYETAPDLIAGVVIKQGDTIYDYSTAGQLRQLAEAFV